MDLNDAGRVSDGWTILLFFTPTASLRRDSTNAQRTSSERHSTWSHLGQRHLNSQRRAENFQCLAKLPVTPCPTKMKVRIVQTNCWQQPTKYTLHKNHQRAMKAQANQDSLTHTTTYSRTGQQERKPPTQTSQPLPSVSVRRRDGGELWRLGRLLYRRRQTRKKKRRGRRCTLRNGIYTCRHCYMDQEIRNEASGGQ